MVRQLNLGFWKVVRPRTSTTAGLSWLVHVVLIALAVVGSDRSARVARETYQMLVAYMPPPNPEMRSRSAEESRETLRYVELVPVGEVAGFGASQIGADRAPQQSDSRDAGNTGKDTTTATDQAASEGTDSIYTVIDVDTAATRLAESAAPQYPRELLEKRLEGQAIVQFVVDTNGRADTTSFKVMLASHVAFAASVREALPEMRFTTARIGTVKVRQLVELPFNFKLVLPAIDSTTTVRRPRARPSGQLPER